MRINHKTVVGGKLPATLSKYNELINKNIVLLVCIPTRDGKCSLDFTTSLVQTCELLQNLNIPVILNRSNNSCFVDLSRNMFVTQFMKSKCTHMLQIDDDMSWNPEAVLEMLSKDKEFIAGIGRKKIETEEYAGINFTDENGTPIGELGKYQEDCLIKMKYIGGAFTLHKRSVFEKLSKKFPNFKSDGAGKDGYYFYHCQYNKLAWHTEDYVFCHLCEEAGIDVWCYPNVDMGHYGIKNYKGNWFKHLRNEKMNQGISKVSSNLNPKGLLI